MALSVPAIVLAVALLAGTVTAPASTPGPQASAAKKLNKKKLKQKAKNYLQNAVWTNINASTFGTITTYIAFCADGKYAYRKDNDSAIAASQTTWNGTWRVTSAGRTSARVRYTVANFSSIYYDGSPGPDSPPPSPSVLTASAGSANQAFFDGIEFTRGSGGC